MSKAEQASTASITLVMQPECVIDVALSTDVEGERAQQPLGLPLPSPELIVASEPLQGCSQESFIQDGTSTSSESFGIAVLLHGR